MGGAEPVPGDRVAVGCIGSGWVSARMEVVGWLTAGVWWETVVIGERVLRCARSTNPSVGVMCVGCTMTAAFGGVLRKWERSRAGREARASAGHVDGFAC